MAAPTRIDWYDDPEAPSATHLRPAAGVVARDDRGRILLIRRTDDGTYALPGGGMELGETIADTAVRETQEETGYQVAVTGLAGIYTDPRHVIEYRSNGEVRQEFSILFTARVTGGEARTNPEASEVVWVDPVDLVDLPMTASMRTRIDNALNDIVHLG